jgi:hypothetical protein
VTIAVSIPGRMIRPHTGALSHENVPMRTRIRIVPHRTVGMRSGHAIDFG